MDDFDMQTPFRRRRDGTYAVALGPDDRRLLGDLVVQLRSLLTTDSPALARLFPPPYGDDEDRNRGYAVLAGAELVERRLASLEQLDATLDQSTLDEDQLETWMRCINDVRLVLGTILDVTEDDGPDLELDDEIAPLYATYEYLGYLLDRIVSALSS